MDQIVQHAERGKVLSYSAQQCFGFIQPNDGGRHMFFHKSRLERIGIDDIAGGTNVAYVRGRDRDGRLQVDRFVEVNGQNVVEIEMPQSKAPIIPASVVAPRTAVPISVPKKSTSVAPPAEDWLRVRLRKLRLQHTTYAESDIGTVLVPWAVFEHTNIRNARRDEQFEVKYRKEAGELIASEIRRV